MLMLQKKWFSETHTISFRYEIGYVCILYTYIHSDIYFNVFNYGAQQGYRDSTQPAQVCLQILPTVLTYPRIYVPCNYVYSVFTEVRKPRLHAQEKFS